MTTRQMPPSTGPRERSGTAVLAAKEGLVGKRRAMSKTVAGKDTPPKKDAPPPAKPDPVAVKVAIVELSKQVEEADAKIRDAAKPKPLHFVLAPVK